MPIPTATVETVTSLETLKRDILASKDPNVCLDTETTGLRWMAGDRAFGLAVSWDDKAAFLRNEVFSPEKMGLLISDLYGSEKDITFHNAEFDLHMIRESYGVEAFPNHIVDTLRIGHLLDSGADHSLKGWSRKVFGPAVSYYEDQIAEYRRRYKIKDYSRLPAVILDPYACNDAILTKALVERFGPDCQRDYPRWYGVEHDLIPVITKMERTGLRIDVDYIQKRQRKLLREEYEIEKKIARLVGKPLNIGSPAQISQYFYSRMGIRLQDISGNDTGETSTGVEILKAIIDADPEAVTAEVAQLLIAWRAVNKERTTYMDSYLELAVNGRLHPHWNACGTITGRFSGSGPNPQNIPRNLAVRRCFIPDRWFVDFDFCLAPGTRVLKADFSWVPIETLKEGDELIGIEEERTKAWTPRKMRRSKVERVGRRIAESYRINFDNNISIVASGEHPWLARNLHSHKQSYDWIKTQELKPGYQISKLSDPWEEDTSWEAGYLSGFFDGEGSVSSPSSRGPYAVFVQKPGPIYDGVTKMLAAKGFEVNSEHTKKSGFRASNDTKAGHITGLHNIFRFLGTIRPRRLVERGWQVWEERQPPRVSPATVTSIEYLGLTEVVSLQTNTHTFVAEGLFSHNSQIEYRMAAFAAKQESMVQAFIDGLDFHAFTAGAVFGKDIADIDKDERTIGKTINFLTLYGGGAEKFAIQAGISIPEAEVYLRAYWKTNSNLDRWVKRTIDIGKREGHVFTLLGRKVPLQDRPYAAPNYVIQGTAGDILKISLLRTSIIAEDLGVDISNTVHDQIVFDGLEHSDVPRMVEQMESFNFEDKDMGLTMPIIVDVKDSTKSWGDMGEEWKPEEKYSGKKNSAKKPKARKRKLLLEE